MANITQLTWADATTNLDTTPITAGEITGYQIGVRPSTGTAGTYPILTPVAATATTEPLANLSQVLLPGKYAAAIMSLGPVNSNWSTEYTFTLTAPQPNPPTNFGGA